MFHPIHDASHASSTSSAAPAGWTRWSGILLLVFAAGFMTACEDKTAGDHLDDATEDVRDAAEDVGDKTEDVIDDVEDEVDNPK